MKSFWKSYIYKPMLVLFLAILGFVPGGSLGLAIIIITILIKVVLLPLSLKASRSAIKMRTLQPKINAIRIKHTDKQAQAMAMMELYRAEGVSPFSGFSSLLIQIPILIALYQVLSLDFINGAIPFDLQAPTVINHMFLGIDLLSRSVVLALLVAVSQYFMAKITATKNEDLVGDDMQTQLTRSMQMQMRYIFPVMMFGLAYVTNGALSLYLFCSILLSIAQELFVKKFYAKKS